MGNYANEYQRWLNSSALTEKEKEELVSIANDEEAKALRFTSPMDFGTAGLRSTMYMGIGCMNRFTVAQTTRGIAALIKEAKGEERGVAIAYDSRNNSELFAKVSASVLAGAGIKSYIFDGIRPTPELSFAVRELSCMAGINITASHNPKEYNGYKAYWEDGAQISPEQAKIVSDERSKYDVLDLNNIMDFEEGVKTGLITVLDEAFDEKYLQKVLATAVSAGIVKEVADDLKVVYTPLHGAGYKLVPEVFRRVGLKHLYTVDEQMITDGNFPTVEKPNPEYAAVFKLGIEIANKVGSDLVIATDPDSDRVGVMYLGNFVEMGDKKDIFANPMHPYTQALFSAVPVPDPHYQIKRIILQGDIPSPANPPKGCKFHTRCPRCMDICKEVAPKFIDYGNGHMCACHLYSQEPTNEA